jgi:hypothetical protein
MKSILIILILFSFNARAQSETGLSYDLIKKQSVMFDRKILNISGIVSELKVGKGKNNLKYFDFKLSKTSKVDRYIHVFYYQHYDEEELTSDKVKNGQIINLEGEFRRNYEIAYTKKIGDLYINLADFNKARIAKLEDDVSEGINNKNDKIKKVSVFDFSTDFFEPESSPVIQLTGYIKSLEYVDEKNGNTFWEIKAKDHLTADTKKWSNYYVTLRYYLTINGKRYADLNFEDIFQVGDKINFTGRYNFIDKSEISPHVASIDINYVNQTTLKYKDHFVGKFNILKRAAVAIVSNANSNNQDSEDEDDEDF